MSDDKTKAEALRIAYDRKTKLGWSFTPEDVGSYAAKMIRALNEGLTNDR